MGGHPHEMIIVPLRAGVITFTNAQSISVPNGR
jgi:hypothetical protein